MKLTPYILACLLATTMMTGLQAQAAPDYKTVSPASSVEAKSAPNFPVTNLYQALNTIQQPKSGSFTQRIAILSTALEQSYDFPTILQKTVGYRFNGFSEQQKSELLKAFKNYTVARYLSSFGANDDNIFKILPKNKPSTVGKGMIVSTVIVSDGDSTPIDYLVHQTDEGWKIVDVLLNGHISQVAIQHGDFNSTLVKGGSQALIDMLNQKTKSFSIEK
ncbi:hypothetical protein COMNV_00519 [Commensalibacter sp. Nvir]|uniref:ABC transporter substrate-binding protein n=1 Tax=Commensalibacter sp. Nvir TaxID=3069817 RepID=UPI002D5CAC8A|nr:hypothetical protein COMNV_00519 [Commensalibacter sp. Nvir]